jgi:hypothetical protein
MNYTSHRLVTNRLWHLLAYGVNSLQFPCELNLYLTLKINKLINVFLPNISVWKLVNSKDKKYARCKTSIFLAKHRNLEAER